MHNPHTDAKPGRATDLPNLRTQYVTSAHNQLTPSAADASRAARARVGIAAAHLADLLVPGAVAGKVAYLDDDGSPVVLCSRDLPFPSGRTGLRIALSGGGQLALLGRAAERPLSGAEARRISAKLVQHRHCLTGVLDPKGAIPVRFEIETALISTQTRKPKTRTVPSAGPKMVPLVDYVDSTPDLFAELGLFLATHLVEAHQDLLLTAARRTNPGGELLAVGARGVFAGGLTLDVVDEVGSHEVPVRFERELAHPHQFGAALRAYAFESPQ